MANTRPFLTGNEFLSQFDTLDPLRPLNGNSLGAIAEGIYLYISWTKEKPHRRPTKAQIKILLEELKATKPAFLSFPIFIINERFSGAGLVYENSQVRDNFCSSGILIMVEKIYQTNSKGGHIYHEVILNEHNHPIRQHKLISIKALSNKSNRDNLINKEKEPQSANLKRKQKADGPQQSKKPNTPTSTTTNQHIPPADYYSYSAQTSSTQSSHDNNSSYYSGYKPYVPTHETPSYPSTPYRNDDTYGDYDRFQAQNAYSPFAQSYQSTANNCYASQYPQQPAYVDAQTKPSSFFTNDYHAYQSDVFEKPLPRDGVPLHSNRENSPRKAHSFFNNTSNKEELIAAIKLGRQKLTRLNENGEPYDDHELSIVHVNLAANAKTL